MAINMTPRGPYESDAVMQFTLALASTYEQVTTFNHLLGVIPDEVSVVPVFGTKAGTSGYTTAADDAAATVPASGRVTGRSAAQVLIMVEGNKGDAVTFYIKARRVKRR